LKEKYCELQKGEQFFEISKKHFVNAVSDFFKDMRLFQITPLDIEQFKKQRKETPVRGGKIRSGVSVNRELEVFRHMLNKAVEWGMLDANPFARFKDPIFFEENNDRVRFLEEDEIKKLLDVSPPYLLNLIKGAIFTGLRKGDLFNLKWSDVNLERGFLNYREQKKRDKLGFKYLNGDMIGLLMEIPKRERVILSSRDPMENLLKILKDHSIPH
jgi:integrase